MPFAIGGNQLDTGYEVSNSLRFNSGDSPELTRTFGSAGGDTWSYSCWLKRGDISQQGHGLLLDPNTNAGLYFLSTGALVINDDGSSTHTSTELLRDPNAWYHILFTGNGTTNKVYVNNSQLTFSGGTPNIGDINNNVAHSISKSPAGVEYMDGYLSEIHFVDGTEKAPTDFAEFNDNGVWIPKKYTGTYGTNGFFLQFKQTGTSANSSGIGADTSGNDNHFTPTNLAATDVTTDTPTNNFATLNTLSEISTSVTFSEGNTKASIGGGGSGNTNRVVGNMGFTSGKWYYEVKYISQSSGASHLEIGFVNTDISMRYHIRGSDGERWDNGSTSSGTDHRHDPGDIIGVYIDADNKKWYLQVNGSNSNGGNGTADVSAGTGFIHQNFAVTDFILPYFANASGGGGHVFEVNFGNAPFSISSGNADAEGHGNFEYNPTNDGVDFHAICTKNLSEYG